MAADEQPRSGSHSLTLERGLRVLRVLAEHPDGLSVSQLAKALETHRAGVYRLLGPLVDQRFVVRADDGRHRLGVGLIELASQVRPSLQDLAVAELRRLADDLGVTTALTLRDGEEAVVTAVVEPRSTDFHIAYRAGLRHELDRAASGIALLAALPPRPGERRAITEARGRGWASSRGELLPGATGVGVAVPSPDGRPEASLSAIWIEGRDERAVAERLVEAAGAVAAGLHGSAARSA